MNIMLHILLQSQDIALAILIDCSLQERNFENSSPVPVTTFKPSEKKKSSVKEHRSRIFFLSKNPELSNVQLFIMMVVIGRPLWSANKRLMAERTVCQ